MKWLEIFPTVINGNRVPKQLMQPLTHNFRIMHTTSPLKHMNTSISKSSTHDMQ